MTYAIDAAHISKKYGGISVLDDVSLQVNEGEIFGFFGPDGSGKSSLFRILATLADADSGTASVMGLDLKTQYRQIRRQTGYMPGVFSLYPDLTVEENIKFYASIFGNSPEECYDLIEPVYKRLEPFRKRRAGKLSGGMKQKLALCCSLIHKPKLLFLDEPTTGVDAVSRKELFDMLVTLNLEYGITIVVSTPYREEILCCHRVALMNQGRIVAVGNPKQIIPKEETILHPVSAYEDDKVIEVRGLTKAFGSFIAVNNISFSVSRGEIFGFLGANGAGKTTAMRILSGLSSPTSGEGMVAGYDICTEGEQIKRHIGYMSQRFSLYKNMTVRENMQLFGGIYGLSRSEVNRRIDSYLHKLDFEDIQNVMVCNLPLGWKQKLAFVVATLHEPEVVFLDEPTGGVDAETRHQFWQLISQAAERGMTIFVTTHYMDEAMFCHRVCIMDEGRIRVLDTPENLMRRYNADSLDQVFRQVARGLERVEQS